MNLMSRNCTPAVMVYNVMTVAWCRRTVWVWIGCSSQSNAVHIWHIKYFPHPLKVSTWKIAFILRLFDKIAENRRGIQLKSFMAWKKFVVFIPLKLKFMSKMKAFHNLPMYRFENLTMLKVCWAVVNQRMIPVSHSNCKSSPVSISKDIFYAKISH